MVFFFAPIAWMSVYGALLALPTVPLLLRRISIEERVLALRFGAEYKTYSRSTRRLIPFVY